MGSSDRPLSIYSSLMVISTIIGYFGVSDADVLLRDPAADKSNGLLLRNKLLEEQQTELEDQHPFRRYTINNDKMKLLTQKSKDGRNESVTYDESMWEQLVIRALANPTEWVQLRQALDKVDADLRALTSMENSKQNQSKAAPKWKFTYHRVTSPQFPSPNSTRRTADGKTAGLGKAKAFAAISIPHIQPTQKLDSHPQEQQQQQLHPSQIQMLDNSPYQYQPEHQSPQQHTSSINQFPLSPKSEKKHIDNYINVNVPYSEIDTDTKYEPKFKPPKESQSHSQDSLVTKNKSNWKLKGRDEAEAYLHSRLYNSDEDEDEDDDDEDDDDEANNGESEEKSNHYQVESKGKMTQGGKQMSRGNSNLSSLPSLNPNPHPTTNTNTHFVGTTYIKNSHRTSEKFQGRSRSQLEEEIAKMSSLSKARKSKTISASNDDHSNSAYHPSFHWKPWPHHSGNANYAAPSKSNHAINPHPNPVANTQPVAPLASTTTRPHPHPHPASLPQNPLNLNERHDAGESSWSETLKNFHDQLHAASHTNHHHHHQHHRYYYHPHPPSAFRVTGHEMDASSHSKGTGETIFSISSNSKGHRASPSTPKVLGKDEHEKTSNVQYLEWSAISQGNGPADENDERDNQYHWRQRHQREHEHHPPTTKQQPPPSPSPPQPSKRKQESSFSARDIDTPYEGDRDRIFSSLSRRSTSLEYKI